MTGPLLARKKPVVVQVVLYDGTAGCARFLFDWSKGTVNSAVGWSEGHRSVFVDTLEGRMEARAGDYIIRGVKGEHYPCKPDIFAATYDVVGNVEAKE